MNRLSQRSRLITFMIFSLWIIIGVAYYRNMNLTLILPMFVLVLIHRIFSKGLVIQINKKSIFIVLFAVYYIFTSVIFFRSSASFTNLLIRYVMLPIIAFYVTSLLMGNGNKSKLFFVQCLKLFIMFFALFGIYEWYVRYNPISSFISTGAAEWINRMNEFSHIVYYPSSFFTHYTYFAYVLLVGWLLALSFPSKNKIIDYLYKGTVLFALIVSQSRMAWITFIVIMVIYYLFFARKARLTWLIGTPVAMFILYVTGVFGRVAALVSTRFSRIFSMGFSDGSLGQRFGTLQNISPYMAEHPLKALIGGGYASTVYDFLPKYSFFTGFQTTDSMLTTYLVEAGIIGSILLAVGLVIYLISLDTKEPFDRFIFLFLVMTLIEMFFFDFFANNITLFLFYMVWGVMAARAGTKTERNSLQ